MSESKIYALIHKEGIIIETFLSRESFDEFLGKLAAKEQSIYKLGTVEFMPSKAWIRGFQKQSRRRITFFY